MISGRQEFFPSSIEHLQIFSSIDCADNLLKKFFKSRITGVVSADNFFQMHLWGRQFISAIFLNQTSFLPGGGGGIMVRPHLTLNVLLWETT